jgi:hypothetical protein
MRIKSPSPSQAVHGLVTCSLPRGCLPDVSPPGLAVHSRYGLVALEAVKCRAAGLVRESAGLLMALLIIASPIKAVSQPA